MVAETRRPLESECSIFVDSIDEARIFLDSRLFSKARSSPLIDWGAFDAAKAIVTPVPSRDLHCADLE
jgi:hypothetical protein